MNVELVASGSSEMTVRVRCDALGVAEQGYDAHCARRVTPSERAKMDSALSDAIAVAHEPGRKCYGAPRLKDALEAQGFRTSR